ncbi:ABC transporter permease [Roseateles amylovorans]|uniref:ABC transporter permease n=1 Tax=Roseateles amylovorans TaxID=2978473 RepID=A0ABY6B3R5_9BURK|nr:FtsX-like permease family protein [Roseateles amylovorans]UXH79874.1 ABC transporter permease [Roseateles amylovorans]
MDILPILSTLKRHKTAAGLIVLQIALTCAIVCNALFLISERIDRISEPSGLAEDELIVMQVSGMTRVDNDGPQTQSDLQALRQIPGVKQVSIANQIPYGQQSSYSGVRLRPGDNENANLTAANYLAGENFLETSGLRLTEGRDFLPSEFVEMSRLEGANPPQVPAIIINREMARRLFPNGSALGQGLYVFSDEPHRIVGVVDRLVAPNPGSGEESSANTMILPLRPGYRSGSYLLRVDPAQREAALKAAAEKLLHNSPGMKRLVREQKLLSDQRDAYYRQDRSMIQLLAGVCVGLLVVTAFGIVGLASFWVQQRTRMIGTRRALGATRGQILRYFQTENLLLSTVGIVIGMVGAYGISLLLMRYYELPRLPALYLPIGALVLWTLGQIAVFGPARRAAALPPVVALRGG